MATPRRVSKAPQISAGKPKPLKTVVKSVARTSPPKLKPLAKAGRVSGRSELEPMKKMGVGRKVTRVSRGPSGRIYGGESAPKYSPLGTKHYVNDDDYGVGNRMYGQDRPKKAPAKGGRGEGMARPGPKGLHRYEDMAKRGRAYGRNR